MTDHPHQDLDADRFDIDDVLLPDTFHPWWPWFCPKPTVRILFYTDDFSVVANMSNDFGVGRLCDLILTKNTFYVDFHIDVINRHEGGHATDKLTPAVLAG
jgi:hypothetical protein